MPTEILIALIAAGAAALLAILALLIAVVANVGAGKAARAVEAVEHEVRQGAGAEWMKSRELESWVKLRNRSSGAIQNVKEQLERILRSDAGTLDREGLIQQVSSAGRALMTLQNEVQAQLNQVEQIALLRAKDAALQASSRVRDALKDLDQGAQLADADRRAIRAFRCDLAESQAVFRDAVANRMLKRILDHGGGKAES